MLNVEFELELYITSKMTLQVILHGLVLGNSDPNEVIAFDDLSFSPGCVSSGGNTHPHTHQHNNLIPLTLIIKLFNSMRIRSSKE